MADPLHVLLATDSAEPSGLGQHMLTLGRGLARTHRVTLAFPEAEFAARAALAALPQGKYWQMHTGLMSMKSRAEEPTVMRVARAAGLDEARLRRDMEAETVLAHITRSNELADNMGLQGTPSFIAGDEGAFGAFTLAELQSMVKRARETLG